MKISINREECIGCATCEALCPQVFKLAEDGKSSIIETYRKGSPSKGEVEENLASCVESAKEACPVQVISTQ
ncbi:MAG: ferredoxin [Candidatus Bathyarchaeia archaeon]